jgi:hypothetical protein
MDVAAVLWFFWLIKLLIADSLCQSDLQLISAPCGVTILGSGRSGANSITAAMAAALATIATTPIPGTITEGSI